jgi:hypothetical protein
VTALRDTATLYRVLSVTPLPLSELLVALYGVVKAYLRRRRLLSFMLQPCYLGSILDTPRNWDALCREESLGPSGKGPSP